ncbi:MAG: alpha/beta fold hydrolase [Candidatus Riflebacteria bacterium]|nr:alpha/beta fold hydrolase [Candidatus Riflebacteria bacterium]
MSENILEHFDRLINLSLENCQILTEIGISNVENLLAEQEVEKEEYRGVTPFEVVYQFDSLRVLKFQGTKDTSEKIPILLIPSMINRSYVMDLMKDNTLVGFLKDSGLPTYLLDWGNPGPRHNHLPFEFYVDDLIKLACDAVVRDACCKKTTGTPCKGNKCNKISLLGYCMGGTMALLHSALHPERINKLTLLATPINFIDDSTLSHWARKETFNVDALVNTLGAVDPLLLQSSFLMVKPLSQLQKWKTLYESALNQKSVDSFIHLERWVTDNIPVPREAYRDYLKLCYHKNAVVNNKVVLKGQEIDFRNFKTPILNIMAKKDHIVPIQSSQVLKDLVSSEITEVIIDAGHVGVAMGKKAREMFQAVAKFNLGDRVKSCCIVGDDDDDYN